MRSYYFDPSTAIATLTPSDAAWPHQLGDLKKPPDGLRIAGTLPQDPMRSIAIVGTRRASALGLALASRWAADFAREGWIVISGGAEGIDAAAHRGSLEVGGRGIVVLAGGLDRPFPRAHAPLFAAIARGHGAVITEAADEVDPRAHLFLLRNRLIAALARATVVIQAPLESGALSSAKHARDLERPVFAAPWSLDDPRGRGCNALIAAGGRLCESAAQVIAVLEGRKVKPTRRTKAERHSLDPDASLIHGLLGGTALHPDELVARSALPVPRVRIALTTLTLLGLAAPDDCGAFMRVRD